VANEVAARIVEREGYRQNTYKDTRGIPTQGFGFNMKDPVTVSLMPLEVQQGRRQLTPQEAQVVLQKRIALAQADAQSFVGEGTYKKLDPNRQFVLTDMAYNMGGARLSGFHNLREKMQAGDMQGAADEVVNSNYARAKDTSGRAYKNAYTVLTGQPYDTNKVREFQKLKGLATDGAVGPKTWKHLRGDK